MAKREYGQFCGLARAAEVLGQRWTLLILRDLMVGPRRYSDLAAGLPGIPTNLLSTRLKDLEQDGLVTREVRSGTDRSIVYALTPRGAELEPVLDAISVWGAGGMREPREGEVVTEPILVAALRLGAKSGKAPAGLTATYTVRVGDAAAHAIVRAGAVEVRTGEHPSPDLVILGGPGFRDLLAGELDPAEALEEGLVEVDGDPSLLDAFVTIFTVPYSAAVAR